MRFYKSWLGLKKELESRLCVELQGHITYFLTRYHEVHNAYGRASVRYDGKELVNFTWHEMTLQEADLYSVWKESGKWDRDDPNLQSKWEENATYSDMDFLSASLRYLDLPIKEALFDPDPLVRMFAILDARVGKRTADVIRKKEKWQEEPDWLKQFYRLRFGE